MTRNRNFYYIKRIKKLFWMATVFFGLNSLTFLAMPFVARITDEKKSQIGFLVVGLAFWIFMIYGYVLLFVANSNRRKYLKQKGINDLSMGYRIGIISFFSNIPAIIADTILFISIISLTVILFLGDMNSFIVYVLLAVLVFSIYMHCLFNGRIYKITKYKRVRRNEQ